MYAGLTTADKVALLDAKARGAEWVARDKPVVRCKDCEYSGKIDSIFQTWCKKDMRRVNNDFYCAHGKERER